GRVYELGRHRTATGDDVKAARAEVAGGLGRARGRVVALGEDAQHDVVGGKTHAEASHDVAVVRCDPVLLGDERPGDADLGRLVAGAGEDERSAALPVEGQGA